MRSAMLGASLLILLSSCEQVFTFSPVSSLQRDPSTLSDEAKVTFAEAAISSGDKAAMEKAYNALKDTENNELKVVAAEVAVGAAGLNDAIDSAISLFTNPPADPDAALAELLDGLDAPILSNAGTLLQGAVNGGVTDIEEDVYVAVVVGLVASAMSQISDLTTINTNDLSDTSGIAEQGAKDDIDLAVSLAASANLSIDELGAIFLGS